MTGDAILDYMLADWRDRPDYWPDPTAEPEPEPAEAAT